MPFSKHGSVTTEALLYSCSKLEILIALRRCVLLDEIVAFLCSQGASCFVCCVMDSISVQILAIHPKLLK